MQFVDHDELLKRLGDSLTEYEEVGPPVEVPIPRGPVSHTWSTGLHDEVTVLVAKGCDGEAAHFHSSPSDGSFFHYRCSICNLACTNPDQLPVWATECNDVFDMTLVEEIMDL